MPDKLKEPQKPYPTVDDLRVLAKVVAVLSVIAAILCVIFLSSQEVIDVGIYSTHTKTVFSPLGIICALSIVLGGTITWYTLTALARILEYNEWHMTILTKIINRQEQSQASE